MAFAGPIRKPQCFMDPQDEKFLVEMGARIYDARMARDLLQEEVGALAGITQEQISNYERGICAAPPYRLKRVADALRVSVDHLMGGKRPSKSRE